ncbi:C-C motif chemokine 2-like isoform X2 [Pygocentrus nattereri]|uniref:C-C motif chemokine 2-like isoform X2 n=1 Tax=Pygocentrus nattereri TaxID=42514 RepID=UPI001891AA3E|nr:C-C motif chemokine 2-like isoform X2 [Pygocentrus nattereri]
MQLFVILLLAVQWTATTLAGIGPPEDCCLRLSYKNIEVTKIEKYVLQDPALCSIKAVRFTTIHGRTVCADPERSWTKFAMCVVDKRKSASRAEAVAICKGLTVKTPSKPSTTVPPKTSSTAPSNPSTRVPSNPSMTATPVSMPSKKTAGRIETETTVKSPVEDDSLKKSSPSFNRESSESRKSSDENESPAGISKTKNTELEESLYSEERDTLSSVMNEQSPNKNTMFCIKQVPAKSSRSYFCIKGSL